MAAVQWFLVAALLLVGGHSALANHAGILIANGQYPTQTTSLGLSSFPSSSGTTILVALSNDRLVDEKKQAQNASAPPDLVARSSGTTTLSHSSTATLSTVSTDTGTYTQSTSPSSEYSSSTGTLSLGTSSSEYSSSTSPMSEYSSSTSPLSDPSSTSPMSEYSSSTSPLSSQYSSSTATKEVGAQERSIQSSTSPLSEYSSSTSPLSSQSSTSPLSSQSSTSPLSEYSSSTSPLSSQHSSSTSPLSESSSSTSPLSEYSSSTSPLSSQYSSSTATKEQGAQERSTLSSTSTLSEYSSSTSPLSDSSSTSPLSESSSSTSPLSSQSSTSPLSSQSSTSPLSSQYSSSTETQKQGAQERSTLSEYSSSTSPLSEYSSSTSPLSESSSSTSPLSEYSSSTSPLSEYSSSTSPLSEYSSSTSPLSESSPSTSPLSESSSSTSPLSESSPSTSPLSESSPSTSLLSESSPSTSPLSSQYSSSTATQEQGAQEISTVSEFTTLHAQGALVSSVCNRIGRECIKEASCEGTEKGQECQCLQGTTGNGYMECVKEGSWLCTVDCDPHVTSFSGERSDVTLPCWYRVTSVRVPVDKKRKGDGSRFLEIEIYGENTLTPEGLYFVEKVRIQVTLIVAYPTDNHTEAIGTNAWTLSVQDILSAAGSNPWDPPELVTWQGLSFRFQWDAEDQFAIWTPAFFTGLRVKFRAYDPSLQPQPKAPGISVTLPDSELEFVHEAEDSVCMSVDQTDTFIRDMAQQWNIHPPPLITLYYALRQSGVEDDNKQCQKTRKMLEGNKCKYHPKLAIKLCGFILGYKRTRTCLLKGKQDPMSVFNDCVKWACRGYKKSCKDADRILSDCPTTIFFKKIGCKKSHLKKANKDILQTEKKAVMPK